MWSFVVSVIALRDVSVGFRSVFNTILDDLVLYVLQVMLLVYMYVGVRVSGIWKNTCYRTECSHDKYIRRLHFDDSVVLLYLAHSCCVYIVFAPMTREHLLQAFTSAKSEAFNSSGKSVVQSVSILL